jgi:hypothetical protein
MKKAILLTLCLSIYFVGQAQVSKTVNVTTAGTLREQFTTTEMTSVTNLTVTGNLNARDFKFMRRGITNLSVLDIGAVTIQAYNGTSGTSDATSYPANELPTSAFDGCVGLTNITIPNSVTSIGDAAFIGCSGLTSITIPNSVTSIGDNAFENCSGLTSITIGNSVISIGNYAFNSCSGLTSITIGNSVTSIGDYAFGYCSRLTSITIPNSVISIGNYAFISCRKLTSITIPNSVISIGNYAFISCSGLTSITIPNSVTSIGDDAFENCSGLTSITIGNSVTSIGDWAFENCTNLVSIYIYATTPIVLPSNVFYAVNIYACTLYVPAGSKNAYQAALIWGDFLNIVEMAPTALPTLISESVNIYLNPVMDGFQIDGLEGTGTLTLTDLNGKALLTKQVMANCQVSQGCRLELRT